jgi:hypothetical protein
MSLITFMLISFSLGVTQVTAATSSRDLEDYGLGSVVGRCLAVRCQIFSGVVLTEIAKPEEPVAVRVEETLFGSDDGPQVMRLPWQDDPHQRERGAYLSSAWAKADIRRNASVTVVLALEQGYGVFPGEPVLVTSSERDSMIIRSLADDARRLRESPERISDMVASLSGNANPALAGYLFFHLTHGKANYSRDLAATLLSDLLASLLNPMDLDLASAGFLPSTYPALEPSTQVGVVTRLVELAQRPDSDGARAAFEGLAKIASLDNGVVGMLPPASLPALGDAYRQLVKTGSIAAEPLLEQMLGKKR